MSGEEFETSSDPGAVSLLHLSRADKLQTGGTMSSRVWSATCAAIVLGVSVGILAQESPAPQAGSQSAAAKKTITVSGCIAKAEAAQTPTGTAGAGAAAAAKEAKFVLNDAAMASSGTAGTAGAPATAIASNYKLDGDDAKLTPHVGHKVEITGTVEEAKGAATQAPAASAANAPTLKVDSVKMVAPSCK
jgi:hypothetical protein